MKTRDEISNLLKNVYKKYSTEELNSEMNTSYVTNMLMIELLCDIRDLLEEELDNHKVALKHRRLHMH